MIDFRHETFLALCEIMNYTKTAEFLHITQPAVTQHIQFLEDKYQCQLFHYENKKLTLTTQGKELRSFLSRIVSDMKHFKRNIKNNVEENDSIVFGATLSIGEYLMPDILSQVLIKDPRLTIHMEVGNTQVLLDKLWNGEIDFAIVEGIFDKSRYHSKLFRLENFIPVCAPSSKLAQQMTSFKDIIQYPLIIREQGSGTREILENILIQHNYTSNSFKNIIEIGNMPAIKNLVANNIGITFLYEMVAEKEIKNNQLTKIDIQGFKIKREFNFVFLKDSFFEQKYHEYFELFQSLMK